MRLQDSRTNGGDYPSEAAPPSEPVAMPGAVARGRAGERGFTLIETMVSIVIMVISILGMASLFTYAIKYNSGADTRQQALAVAQRRMEQLRDAAFTDASLNATAGTSETVTSTGRQFKLTTTITNTVLSGRTVSKTITVSVASFKQDKDGGWNEVKEVTLSTERTTSSLGAL